MLPMIFRHEAGHHCVLHSSRRVLFTRSSCVFFAFPAAQVYDLMREAGIRPNNRSLLDLVNLCRANGLQSVAARIMRQRSKATSTTSRRRNNVSRRTSRGSG